MAILLVTYDLNTPGQKREKLLATIKQYAWAMLSESSYAIDTNRSSKEIYDSLFGIIDSNDQLFVIPLSRPWFGFGRPDVIDWLDSRV